jgi:hypothetical protein
MQNNRLLWSENTPTSSPRAPRGATTEAVETWEGEGGTAAEARGESRKDSPPDAREDTGHN